jgi:hypothetical protein
MPVRGRLHHPPANGGPRGMVLPPVRAIRGHFRAIFTNAAQYWYSLYNDRAIGGIFGVTEPFGRCCHPGRETVIPPRDSIALRALSFVGRSPRVRYRGRKWGRSELNTASQTRRNGTGQLPASDLAGWLKIEAQGCREGTNGSAHTVYPQGGEADTYQPLKAQGKGGCRVKLCGGPAVPLTVETGQNTRETPRGENFALRATT